jgi:hypothetical protein
MSLVDQCPNIAETGCQGRIKIVSLSREERMARRIGRGWIGKCDRCGGTVKVNPAAWRMFVKAQRVVKKVTEWDRGVNAGEIFRFENEGVSDEYNGGDEQ